MAGGAPSSTRLTVLLFGPYQDALGGAASVEVQVHGEVTAAAVLAAVGEQHARLSPMLGHARLAVNGAFAASEAVVKMGDELAIIGLVSGG